MKCKIEARGIALKTKFYFMTFYEILRLFEEARGQNHSLYISSPQPPDQRPVQVCETFGTGP